MAYSAEISRQNPSCFLFVIDQSGSMSDNFNNPSRQKAQGVADGINKLLQNLVIKCAKSEGIRDYYYIGALGYGQKVASAFTGELAGDDLVPISKLADNPARIEERTKKVEDGAGGLVDQTVKFPIWFDAIAENGTPMTQAFQKANLIVDNWIKEHPKSFPPTVIHITDGESTDGDPTGVMQELTQLSTEDGNVLLFNLHLSDNPNARQLDFPHNKEMLPDRYAEMLFETSSLLTPFMLNVAQNEYKLPVTENSKGFVMNGDLSMIITALEIGTRPSNLR